MRRLFVIFGIAVLGTLAGFGQELENEGDKKVRLPFTIGLNVLELINNYSAIMPSISHSVGKHVTLTHEFGPITGVELREGEDFELYSDFSGFKAREEIRFFFKIDHDDPDAALGYVGIGGFYRQATIQGDYVSGFGCDAFGDCEYWQQYQHEYKAERFGGYYNMGILYQYFPRVYIDLNVGIGYHDFKFNQPLVGASEEIVESLTLQGQEQRNKTFLTIGARIGIRLNKY